MLKRVTRLFSYQLPGELVGTESNTNIKGFVGATEVYKPAEKIEFDVNGETLVYSINNAPKYSVFFPFPWSLGTWSIPVAVWQIIEGNLTMSVPLAVGMYLAIMPHCYHLYNLRYHIDKIWYVRGGLWKFQNSGIQGLVSKTYTEPANLNIEGNLDLNDNGQLDQNLVLVCNEWQEYYEAVINQEVRISKDGVVHNSELFQAMLKKIKIDDSNFVINLDPDNSMLSKKCIGK